MPGAADHGDPLEPVLDRLADRAPHEGLAPGLVLVGDVPFADRHHRLGDHLERGVPPVLDRVLPPPLRVVVSGGASERPDRIGPQGGCPGILFLSVLWLRPCLRLRF